jgi:V8-like Glu-specific endopeptidase
MKSHIVAAAIVFAALGSATTARADEQFQARLSGDNEVPPVATDTTGRFKILVSEDQADGEYTLRVDSGVRVTQAHFHCGPAGVNGPVIVFLAGFHATGWDVDGKWVSNATVTDANVVNTACGATLAEIFAQARAGNVYVNVHSVAHPGGVARGQLLPTGN